MCKYGGWTHFWRQNLTLLVRAHPMYCLKGHNTIAKRRADRGICVCANEAGVVSVLTRHAGDELRRTARDETATDFSCYAHALHELNEL